MRFTTVLLSTALLLASTKAATLEKRCSLRREPMTIEDGLLVAKIKVGSNAQTFSVVYDTSNSLTWVPSTECVTRVCRQQSNLYNAESSTTSVNLHSKKVSIRYEEGVCLDARLYRDTISVAGLEVPNQLFGSAYTVKGLGSEKYLGSLGLGGFNEDGTTKYLTSKNSSAPTKRQFVSNGGFAQNGFQMAYGQGSQQFGMVTTNQNGFYQKRGEKTDAEFIFGGVDHNVYKGDVAYFKLPTCDYGDSPFWKTEIKSVRLADTIDIKLAPKSLASFSTGSSFISAPTKQADLLHASIDAKYDEEERMYLFKCCDLEELPTLEIDLKGYRISLPPKAYVMQDSDEVCHTLIDRNTDEKNWVLGGAFLNNFYHVYDASNSQIGLAIPKVGSAAKIEKIKN